jgi:hypothetical protein
LSLICKREMKVVFNDLARFFAVMAKSLAIDYAFIKSRSQQRL